MKRAGKRKNASIVLKRDGYFANVINDTKDKLNGILVVKLKTLDGTVRFFEEFNISLAAFSQTAVKINFDDTVKNSYLTAEINGLKTIYFYDLWKDKVFVTDITVEKKITGEKKAEIKITANKFSRFTAIEFPDGHFVNISDNYFDIEKGDTVTVFAESDKPFITEDIKVLTFADDWKE
jgi:hypothetical protein